MTVYINGTTGYSGPVGVLGDLTTTGNTILGDQSTDTLNVANGNLVLNSSGNLGIGTTSPFNPGSTAQKSFELSGTSYATIYTSASSATVRGQFGADAVGSTVGIGARTNHPLTFATNDTERARITANGDFLFGTTTDQTNTVGVTVKTSQQGFIVYNGVNSNYTELGVWNGASDANKVQIKVDSSGGQVGTRSNDPMRFSTNDTERLRIATNGQLTSTTTEDNILNLASLAGGWSSRINLTSSAGGGAVLNGSYNLLFYVGGTEQARIDSSGRLLIGATAGGGELSFKDVTGLKIQFNSNAANFYGISKLAGGGNLGDGEYRFTSGNTSAGGFTFSSGGSERVRITSGGDTIINGYFTASSRLYASTGIQLSGTFYLAGSGAFYDNSTGYRFTESYGIRFTQGADGVWHHQLANSSYIAGFGASGTNYGSGNCYLTGTLSQNYSDIRLKNDLGTIENALDKVMTLRGFRYTINQLGVDLGFNDVGVEAGLSAQDVKAVLPEAVMLAGSDMAPGENGETISKSGEYYLTLRYDRVVPLLVNAIKELKAELDSVKSELATIKGAA